jgi:hypothetical protein
LPFSSCRCMPSPARPSPTNPMRTGLRFVFILLISLDMDDRIRPVKWGKSATKRNAIPQGKFHKEMGPPVLRSGGRGARGPSPGRRTGASCEARGSKGSGGRSKNGLSCHRRSAGEDPMAHGVQTDPERKSNAGK